MVTDTRAVNRRRTDPLRTPAGETALRALLAASKEALRVWSHAEAYGENAYWQTDARDAFDAAITKAEAALLASGVRQDGWHPISTAPKDGTRVLLYGCEYRRHWFGTGYYFKGVPGDGEGWIASSFLTAPHNDSAGSFNPTHWMPMLTPPAPEEPTTP